MRKLITGQHRYYFANVIDNHPGKWVCSQCYNYYLSKAATTTMRRPSQHPSDIGTSGPGLANQPNRDLPDSAAIRQDVTMRRPSQHPSDNATSGPGLANRDLPDSAAIRRDVNKSQPQGMLKSQTNIPDRS